MVRLSCRKITVLSISISFRPMAEMNRTVQSIKNARVSLFFSVLVLVLGFFSRKILIVNCSSHSDYQNFLVENLRKYYPDPNVFSRDTWDIIERFWNLDKSKTA